MMSMKRIDNVYMLHQDTVVHFMYNDGHGKKSFLILHNFDLTNNKDIIVVDWWWASLCKKDVNKPGFHGMGIGVDDVDKI